MSKIIAAAFFVAFVTCSLVAKDTPTQVINWPQTGSPVVRITLGKFNQISSVAGQHNYVIDTTAENLWSKKISHLGFNLYLYNKNKVRIGTVGLRSRTSLRGNPSSSRLRFMPSAHLLLSNLPPILYPLNCSRSPRRKRCPSP